MRIITGTILSEGIHTESGKFVPLSEVRELIHSVDKIRECHQRLLREITNARLAVEKLASKKNLLTQIKQ